MNILLILSLVAGVVLAEMESHGSPAKDWQAYKTKFKKLYPVPVDEEKKRTFMKNKALIDEHNIRFERGEVSYKLSLNEFSDMTDWEFTSRYGCLMDRGNITNMKLNLDDLEVFEKEENVPESIDWVARGALNPVKNQDQCGSCYAFATVGAIEGRYFVKHQKRVNLSEQNIVDCGKNMGCSGGLLAETEYYIIKNKGINYAEDYPYEMKKGPCRFQRDKVAARVVKFFTYYGEEAMKRAVAKGPIVAGISTGIFTFRNYYYGVYDDKRCASYNIDHAVTIVGYGTDPRTKKDYWLVRNSWSDCWGINGYIKIARGVDMCNIESGEAVSPIVL